MRPRVRDEQHCEPHPEPKESRWTEKIDELKGRAKEAAGDLTDNKDLQREGKTDKATGKVKQKVEDAKDWVEDKIDDIKK